MNNDKAEKRRSSRACLECRLAKTKCHVTDNQDVCDRCAKFSFECRFVRHHRGRKPVSKLANIDADDIDAVAARVRARGGRVLHGPVVVAGGARVMGCEDPQGAAFAVRQAAR